MIRPGRPSLSYRLAWLTVAVVLLAEALVFLPALVRVRHSWLEQRLREGELAALATDVGAPDSKVRLELLHLAGAHAVHLEHGGTTLANLSDGTDDDSAVPIELQAEGWLEQLGRAFGDLTVREPGLLRIHGASLLKDGVVVTVLAEQRDASLILRRFTGREGLISATEAVAAGVLLFVVLRWLLVGPIRRLTASITAFRADPEHTAPPEPDALVPDRTDEIGVAFRELAAMQDELRAALWRHARLAALGTAVAKVCHDLRGVLSPALLTAERLQLHPDPVVQKCGDTLLRAVDRSNDLIGGILAFVREVPLVPLRERVMLRDAVAEATEMERAARPGLHVDNAVAADVALEVELTSVLRTLANLLRNAAEAGATELRVTAEIAEKTVIVRVQDNGPGLPEPVRAALFRPFLSGGRRGSNGLGLAIVRDLARAQGGDAELEHTGPEGTCFRLTLPVARPKLV
jgi:signal transduction histidine kinase